MFYKGSAEGRGVKRPNPPSRLSPGSMVSDVSSQALHAQGGQAQLVAAVTTKGGWAAALSLDSSLIS